MDYQIQPLSNENYTQNELRAIIKLPRPIGIGDIKVYVEQTLGARLAGLNEVNAAAQKTR